MTYSERIGNTAKASAGFDMAGGRATIEYQMPWDEVIDFCKNAIGGVSAEPPYLKRRLPLAHPQFGWLFVERIASIEGFQFEDYDIASDELEAPPIEFYAIYNFAKVVLEFAPRPYALFADDSIGDEDTTYYNEAGAAVTTKTTHEYARFTEYQSKPSAEYLSASHGVFVFAGGGANTKTFPGQVRILKRSKTLMMRWHMVPYLVSEGPNIYEGLSKINQAEFFGYAAGTLLFLGVTTSPPIPAPFPDLVTDPDVGTVTPSAEKIVNIEFNFLVLEPPLGATVTPTNQNHIAAGHNAFPWFFDGKHYYATTGNVGNADPKDGQPAYKSYPFELLFTPSLPAGA